MKKILIIIITVCFLIPVACSQDKSGKSITVPFILDHNRMLVEAELQGRDGSWHKARLWVDSGSTEFFISGALARDLGIDLSAAEDPAFQSADLDIQGLFGIRIGGKDLDPGGESIHVKFQPYWLFTTMQSDGNLPPSLLKKYHIVFDYPRRRLTIADPGKIKPRGNASPASIHPQTGIVQLDASIEGNSYSFALDMGASYSYISEAKLAELLTLHPEWSNVTGTLGYSNMWGWWPFNEQSFSLVRIPKIQWGNITLKNTGIAGVPDFSHSGQTLGEWYSSKTSRPVDGFLGANALKAYRVEIDYANHCVYFEKGKHRSQPEMDMVGISVRQLPDLTYQVLGLVIAKGTLPVQGLEPGDIIVSIDGFAVKGATMGTVVDKLRGKTGAIRQIIIDRNGKKILVNARVEHYL